MTIFESAFRAIVGEEGKLSLDRADPGNWTGGKVGHGKLNGTKYGIAASAHPTLDIAHLTLAQAQTIYRQSYWDPLHADEMPAQIALLAFDSAVNCGIGRSVEWLQSALGIAADGDPGERTLAALKSYAEPIATLFTEMLSLRLAFMSSLPTWKSFRLGWSRRICGLPFLSVDFTEAK